MTGAAAWSIPNLIALAGPGPSVFTRQRSRGSHAAYSRSTPAVGSAAVSTTTSTSAGRRSEANSRSKTGAIRSPSSLAGITTETRGRTETRGPRRSRE